MSNIVGSHVEKYSLKEYDRVVSFLRELYRESETVPHWLPQRWEYAEYLVSPLHKDRGLTVDWKDTVYYWENSNGELVALLCSEYPNEYITLLTKKKYKNLEVEMVALAEENVIPDILHKSELMIWCMEGDAFREDLLNKKGYAKQEEVEYLNWIDLGAPVPEFEIPKGYTLHDMVDETGVDLQKKIERITGAFDSKPYPVKIYRNFQEGPSYRKEYDLYTMDKEGNVCSFCFIWYDPELNIAYFEPVGTDEKHRRKGLGRATLNAGLKRLKRDGVARAFVDAAGDDRMAFYDASGFTERKAFYPWKKELA